MSLTLLSLIVSYLLSIDKKLGLNLPHVQLCSILLYLNDISYCLFDFVEIDQTGDAQYERRNEMVALYSMCDLHLSVSSEESFGLTLVESMACGTPVAAYRTAGSEETVSEGVNGCLVEEGDSEAMLELIKRLVGEPDRWDPVIIRNSVEEKFSVEKQAEKYMHVYETILQESRSFAEQGEKNKA